VQRLTVWIYKASRRAETYLYVPGEEDFQRVPEDLLTALGTLELVMRIELDEQRRLARVDAEEVMKSVSRAGYFLQLAPIEPEGKRQLQ
jgi:hypothetical protein